MNFSALERFLEQTFGKNSGNPGCDILIQQDAQTVYRKQFGFSDIHKRINRGEKEHYRLYSCTKLLTVTGAMRLVESEKLSLDAPVSDYLPSFRNAFLLKNGTRIPIHRPITVHHLFTMTAGLDYRFDKPPILQLFDRNSKTVSLQDFADAAIQSPLLFEPGERFQYSICHDILGAVVEQVTGCRFSDYLYQTIFDPLGMHETFFRASLPSDIKLAPLYRYQEDPCTMIRADAEKDPLFGDRFESGGAGVVSTVTDYGKFAQALSNNGLAANGYRLLKPETVRLMHTDQLESSSDRTPFCCASGEGYSYGFGVRTLVDRSKGQKAL